MAPDPLLEILRLYHFTPETNLADIKKHEYLGDGQASRDRRRVRSWRQRVEPETGRSGWNG